MSLVQVPLPAQVGYVRSNRLRSCAQTMAEGRNGRKHFQFELNCPSRYTCQVIWRDLRSASLRATNGGKAEGRNTSTCLLTSLCYSSATGRKQNLFELDCVEMALRRCGVARNFNISIQTFRLFNILNRLLGRKYRL